MSRASLESPIPLSDMVSVLGWVDTYKLSRQTKKINRDFSDGVLLAEILSVHYPKLVEMHNYPPRNSQSLKLNNWMTLNRKVLKKLKLSLCCNTMEQLANCAPGVIERVLVMVRDKINRDEEANKTVKDAEQNVSSGGSYYEACGDDEHVLVVPVKLRVNGVLETIQQKVVNYESYLTVKEELKDAKDTTEILKQKVEHLDTLLKLKDERIEELQKQLDRKQTRRKEVEAFQNSLAIPFDSEPPTPTANLYDNKVISQVKSNSVKIIESNSKLPRPEEVNTKIVLSQFDSKEHKSEEIKMESVKSDEFNCKVMKLEESNTKIFKFEESKIPIPIVDLMKITSKPSITEVTVTEDQRKSVEKIKSNIFKEIEIVEQKSEWFFTDIEEFKDSEQDTVATVKEIIENESKDITNPIEFVQDFSYVN